jgi:chromosome segregation ATPase
MDTGARQDASIEARLRQWAAELESLKARADTAVAEARKEYYERVDEIRREIEAQLRTWSQAEDRPEPGKTEAGLKTLIERLHDRIRSELRDLTPLLQDLRARAGEAEQEAKRLAGEWRAKGEPARAAFGELRLGVEKAWVELKAALDSAITKFREPSESRKP